MRGHYDVLGINNRATSSEITNAYSRLALILHPDKNNNSEESKQKFIELAEAYNILSDRQEFSFYLFLTSYYGTVGRYCVLFIRGSQK
jgi:DnaJ-class molecular chaperone